MLVTWVLQSREETVHHGIGVGSLAELSDHEQVTNPSAPWSVNGILRIKCDDMEEGVAWAPRNGGHSGCGGSWNMHQDLL